MVKELYTITTKEISLNIVNTKLESVRKKHITKVGYRVYEDGYIGVAGGIGNVDIKSLEEEAINNLELKVPYEEAVSKERTMHRDRRALEFDEVDFICQVEKLLAILRECYPNYTFSNKINMEETYVSLNNNCELDLSDRDLTIQMGLLIREENSVNVFDTFAMHVSRDWDMPTLLQEVENVIGCYHTIVTLPKEDKLPVIIDRKLIETKLIEELNGESIGLGSSLFKDFLGEEKFAPHFTYGQSMKEEAYHVPFFDAEGVVNDDYTCNLIEKGKVLTPYTDKKTARTYGFKLTGSSEAAYDGTPILSMPSTYIKSTGQTLKELLKGDLGILVVVASGGDYTPEGNFGYPIQHAILTDGEKMLGRLPLINIASNVYDMFGKDYRGYTKEPIIGNEQMAVMDMQVTLG